MCNICVYLVNPMRTTKTGRFVGDWLSLPFSAEERDEVFRQLGSPNEYKDFFITHAETENLDIDIDYPATTKLELMNSNAPISDGITKYAGDSMYFDVKASPNDCNVNSTAKSSNSSVIAVSYKQTSMGYTRVTLNFKKAGNATITVTSADGAKSLSYSITVKGDYACNPGSGILTPEQFVNAYNGVVKANGMSTSGMPTGYLVLTLGEGGLTWSKARSAAEGRFHEWWAIGYRTIVLTYEGRDDNGNHVFHVRGY